MVMATVEPVLPWHYFESSMSDGWFLLINRRDLFVFTIQASTDVIFHFFTCSDFVILPGYINFAASEVVSI